MTDQHIVHLYAKIESITKEGHPYIIAISGGSRLLMPPSAEISTNKMAVDDRILIDLEHWDAEGWATVSVFRQDRFVTLFGIGKDACTLQLAMTGETTDHKVE